MSIVATRARRQPLAKYPQPDESLMRKVLECLPKAPISAMLADIAEDVLGCITPTNRTKIGEALWSIKTTLGISIIRDDNDGFAITPRHWERVKAYVATAPI